MWFQKKWWAAINSQGDITQSTKSHEELLITSVQARLEFSMVQISRNTLETQHHKNSIHWSLCKMYVYIYKFYALKQIHQLKKAELFKHPAITNKN